MPDGMRLRWWQEERKETPITAALLAAPETGQQAEEDLEAEARARAAAAARALERMHIVQTDLGRARKEIRRRCLPLRSMASDLVLVSVMFWAIVDFRELIWTEAVIIGVNLLHLGIASLVYRYRLRQLLALPSPILTLSPDGIAICPTVPGAETIPWCDIAGVRADKTNGPADLVIRLRHVRVFERLSPAAQDFARRRLVIGPAKPYAHLAFDTHPDNPPIRQVPGFVEIYRQRPGAVRPAVRVRIPGYLLPVPAETLVARIAAFETGASE